MQILVVDDHPIICDALAKYLQNAGTNITNSDVIVKGVRTLQLAISAINSNEKPDYVFLDLNLDKDHQSIDTIAEFQNNNKMNIPVIIFTGLNIDDDNTADVIRSCLVEFDVRTVLLKGADLNTMFVGLPRILMGEPWHSPEIIDLLLKKPVLAKDGPLDLTPRQWDVARAAARGLRNKEIANELKLSDGNVRQLISAIYKRLGINSRVKLGFAVKAADDIN